MQCQTKGCSGTERDVYQTVDGPKCRLCEKFLLPMVTLKVFATVTDTDQATETSEDVE